jgi:hypothetical protein
MKQNIILLIGSPKARSTSASLAGHLAGLLKGVDGTIRTLQISSFIRTEQETAELLTAVGEADVIVLVSPLYVDSLPSHVIRFLELFSAQRSRAKRQRMFAIINCGFPEAKHNDTATAQCKVFCRETGIEWAGGLGLGGGGMIAGRPLSERGWFVRHVLESLRLTADSIITGRALSPDAPKLMARPLIPTWFYLLVGGSGWRQQAKKFSAEKRLFDKPYAG